MANKLCKFLYNISILAPLLLVYSIVLFIKANYLYSTILILIVGTIIYFQIRMVKYSKKSLSSIPINIIEVGQSEDKWVVVYIISYLLPFIEIIRPDIKSMLLINVSLVVIIIISLASHDNMHNPILKVMGYHTYRVSTENGINDYILLSKNSIRNNKQIKSVIRIFEYLLMEE